MAVEEALRAGADYADARIQRLACEELTMQDGSLVRADAPEGFTFVSVDGGHEVEYALSDIRLAMALAMPEGIILVDDFFAPDWPGVTEALARLYLHDRPQFVPLLAGYNKLLLCHRSHRQGFSRTLVQYIKDHLNTRVHAKVVTLFGYRLINVEPDRSQPFEPIVQ